MRELNIDHLIKVTEETLTDTMKAIPVLVREFYRTYTHTFASVFDRLARNVHMLSRLDKWAVLASMRVSGMAMLAQEPASAYTKQIADAFEEALYWVLPSVLKLADERNIPWQPKSSGQPEFRIAPRPQDGQVRFYPVSRDSVRLLLTIVKTAAPNATHLMPKHGIEQKHAETMLLAFQNILLSSAFCRAKVFVIDNAVLDAIDSASLDLNTEPLVVPYPAVWVEVAHRDKTANYGWLFTEQDAGIVRANGTDVSGIVMMNVLRVPGGWDFEGYTLAHDEYRGYDDDGVIVEDTPEQLTHARSTRMPARILDYLSSKFIEYELHHRTYNGGSKARRKQRYKSYHVVEIKKSYKQYIIDNPGVGKPLDHRVDVVKHPVRYRYCSNCEKRVFVRTILKKGECPECGASITLATVKVVKKERGPLVRKPHLVAQVARTFYRARELPSPTDEGDEKGPARDRNEP